jgi:transcriptional regulator with XRE-family HTH domain
MTLRIKEICKEKGIKMSEIAEKIGISPVNLSASLNGNPTLSRLEKVAAVLGVQVKDLFTDEEPISINGYIEINGDIYKIKCSEDIGKIFNMVCELNSDLIK